MTSLMTTFKTFLRPRFKTTSAFLIATFVATIISLIIIVWNTHSFKNTNISNFILMYAAIGGLALFIKLAQNIEIVWTHNYYRLIPISETKLYLSNFLATLVCLIYYSGVQVILFLLWELILPTAQLQISLFSLPWLRLLPPAIVSVLLCLFWWVFISLIHMATNATAAFLPNTRVRLVRWLIYLVFIIIFSILISQFNRLIQFFFGNPDNASFLMLFTGLSLLIVIISAINIYLLKRWVETTA
ncbi:hypothetical protein ACFQ5M_01335 [Agrilactobacillus yilanensis]|uniref:ABC transporter permease n=1 Tax=Agrilactobacillus yilanensis TaxID=2485997 RepID=A0ABW4J6Z2_9LACO|nr:hypothetical protein [Agrilactobacillus yilanensis]